MWVRTGRPALAFGIRRNGRAAGPKSILPGRQVKPVRATSELSAIAQSLSMTKRRDEIGNRYCPGSQLQGDGLTVQIFAVSLFALGCAAAALALRVWGA